MLDATVTPPPALGIPPMVRPVNVTVTAVLAASGVPPVVMIMDVSPGAPGVSVAPTDVAAQGVGLRAKNPDGYMSVTDTGPAPPADGVKVKVAAAAALFTMRSAAAMANVANITLPPMTPDSTGAEAA